jgi:hypothetical protein
VVLSAVYNSGTNQVRGNYVCGEDERATVWGWTEVLMQCDCGAVKILRPVGNHSGLKSAGEVADLERLLHA